jgi:hypothetical protein
MGASIGSLATAGGKGVSTGRDNTQSLLSNALEDQRDKLRLLTMECDRMRAKINGTARRMRLRGDVQAAAQLLAPGHTVSQQLHFRKQLGEIEQMAFDAEL